MQAGLLRNPVFDAEVKFVEGGGGHILELAVVQEFLDVFQVPLRRRVATRAFEATKLRAAREVGREGQAGGEAVYTYPHHPEVVQNEPGKCPGCRMNLKPAR